MELIVKLLQDSFILHDRKVELSDGLVLIQGIGQGSEVSSRLLQWVLNLAIQS